MYSVVKNSCDKALFTLRVKSSKPWSFGSGYKIQEACASTVLVCTTWTADVSCSGNSTLLLFAALGCTKHTIPYPTETSRGNLVDCDYQKGSLNRTLWLPLIFWRRYFGIFDLVRLKFSLYYLLHHITSLAFSNMLVLWFCTNSKGRVPPTELPILFPATSVFAGFSPKIVTKSCLAYCRKCVKIKAFIWHSHK